MSAGGGGTCPPPLEIQKYGAPTRITYDVKAVKIKKYILKKLSKETELRAPHLVSKETDMRGGPYSKQRN